MLIKKKKKKSPEVYFYDSFECLWTLSKFDSDSV